MLVDFGLAEVIIQMNVGRLIADVTIARRDRVLSLLVSRTGEHQESKNTIE